MVNRAGAYGPIPLVQESPAVIRHEFNMRLEHFDHFLQVFGAKRGEIVGSEGKSSRRVWHGNQLIGGLRLEA